MIWPLIISFLNSLYFTLTSYLPNTPYRSSTQGISFLKILVRPSLPSFPRSLGANKVKDYRPLAWLVASTKFWLRFWQEDCRMSCPLLFLNRRVPLLMGGRFWTGFSLLMSAYISDRRIGSWEKSSYATSVIARERFLAASWVSILLEFLGGFLILFMFSFGHFERSLSFFLSSFWLVFLFLVFCEAFQHVHFVMLSHWLI